HERERFLDAEAETEAAAEERRPRRRVDADGTPDRRSDAGEQRHHVVVGLGHRPRHHAGVQDVRARHDPAVAERGIPGEVTERVARVDTAAPSLHPDVEPIALVDVLAAYRPDRDSRRHGPGMTHDAGQGRFHLEAERRVESQRVDVEGLRISRTPAGQAPAVVGCGLVARRPVSAAEIESLAIGAWILGTGGGGSPYYGLLNMRKLYRAGTVVDLLDPDDLADDDLVAVVSNMGAPLVGQERLTDPQTIARAVTMMEEYLGRTFRAVMSVEIGGGNAIQ